IRYVPFLKLKSNEILALGDLLPSDFDKVCPFFDCPRDRGETEAGFKSAMEKAERSFKRNIENIAELYIDDYDIDDSFLVDGESSYSFMLKVFSDFPYIPVVSIDRTPERIQSVVDAKAGGVIKSEVLAFRVTYEDFVSYEVVADEVRECLEEVAKEFEFIDLVFDCRVCSGLDIEVASKCIVDFLSGFSNDYEVRRVITAGSGVTASIRDVLEVGSQVVVDRKEFELFDSIKRSMAEGLLVFGDYATVSPEYSDTDMRPEIMQNLTAPKIIYAFEKNQFFIRGRALKTHGFEQYEDMLSELCGKNFYRKPEYSEGDKFFYEKSRGGGKNCTPSSVVRPSVNAHIT
ncbi:beta family protein, partial [Ekhidna sp.]